MSCQYRGFHPFGSLPRVDETWVQWRLTDWLKSFCSSSLGLTMWNKKKQKSVSIQTSSSLALLCVGGKKLATSSGATVADVSWQAEPRLGRCSLWLPSLLSETVEEEAGLGHFPFLSAAWKNVECGSALRWREGRASSLVSGPTGQIAGRLLAQMTYQICLVFLLASQSSCSERGLRLQQIQRHSGWTLYTHLNGFKRK